MITPSTMKYASENQKQPINLLLSVRIETNFCSHYLYLAYNGGKFQLFSLTCFWRTHGYRQADRCSLILNVWLQQTKLRSWNCTQCYENCTSLVVVGYWTIVTPSAHISKLQNMTDQYQYRLTVLSILVWNSTGWRSFLYLKMNFSSRLLYFSITIRSMIRLNLSYCEKSKKKKITRLFSKHLKLKLKKILEQ